MGASNTPKWGLGQWASLATILSAFVGILAIVLAESKPDLPLASRMRPAEGPYFVHLDRRAVYNVTQTSSGPSSPNVFGRDETHVENSTENNVANNQGDMEKPDGKDAPQNLQPGSITINVKVKGDSNYIPIIVGNGNGINND